MTGAWSRDSWWRVCCGAPSAADDTFFTAPKEPQPQHKLADGRSSAQSTCSSTVCDGAQAACKGISASQSALSSEPLSSTAHSSTGSRIQPPTASSPAYSSSRLQPPTPDAQDFRGSNSTTVDCGLDGSLLMAPAFSIAAASDGPMGNSAVVAAYDLIPITSQHEVLASLPASGSATLPHDNPPQKPSVVTWPIRVLELSPKRLSGDVLPSPFMLRSDPHAVHALAAAAAASVATAGSPAVPAASIISTPSQLSAHGVTLLATPPGVSTRVLGSVAAHCAPWGSQQTEANSSLRITCTPSTAACQHMHSTSAGSCQAAASGCTAAGLASANAAFGPSPQTANSRGRCLQYVQPRHSMDAVSTAAGGFQIGALASRNSGTNSCRSSNLSTGAGAATAQHASTGTRLNSDRPRSSSSNSHRVSFSRVSSGRQSFSSIGPSNLGAAVAAAMSQASLLSGLSRLAPRALDALSREHVPRISRSATHVTISEPPTYYHSSAGSHATSRLSPNAHEPGHQGLRHSRSSLPPARHSLEPTHTPGHYHQHHAAGRSRVTVSGASPLGGHTPVMQGGSMRGSPAPNQHCRLSNGQQLAGHTMLAARHAGSTSAEAVRHSRHSMSALLHISVDSHTSPSTSARISVPVAGAVSPSLSPCASASQPSTTGHAPEQEHQSVKDSQAASCSLHILSSAHSSHANSTQLEGDVRAAATTAMPDSQWCASSVVLEI